MLRAHSEFSCTEHTKNNKFIANCVASARCLVEHFKKSELACTKLKKRKQQMGVAPLMLIQDVSTRWNSTYNMLSRLLEQRWPVTATLFNPVVNPRAKHHYLDLTPIAWSISHTSHFHYALFGIVIK